MTAFVGASSMRCGLGWYAWIEDVLMMLLPRPSEAITAAVRRLTVVRAEVHVRGATRVGDVLLAEAVAGVQRRRIVGHGAIVRHALLLGRARRYRVARRSSAARHAAPRVSGNE
jgi:hypothetical protein